MKKHYFHIRLPLMIAFNDLTYIWIKVKKLLSLKGYKISLLVSMLMEWLSQH